MGLLDILGGPFTAVAKLGETYLNNKGAEAQAKSAQKIKKLSGTQSWEEKQADASNGSWKDEYLTVLITIPFIMRFGATFVSDAAAKRVDEAIAALNTMPTEYWYLMSATFAAAFAIKGIPAAVNKMRSGKPTRETANESE